MGLITRHIVHNNVSITIEGANKAQITFTHTGLIKFINRAKTYLLVEKNCLPGQQVLFKFDTLPELFIWFFACAEIGLTILVYDESSKNSKENLALYGDIDFIIGDTIDHKIIYSYHNTEKQNYFVDTDLLTLVRTISSGTTGTPKTIDYSHRFLKDISERNANLYNLKSHERCLHNKTLIHSSIVGIYFLPVLIKCEEHFYYDNNPIYKSNFLKTQSINRCVLFRDEFDLIDDSFINILFPLEIFAIGKLPDRFKNLVDNTNIKFLTLFGCSETLGPLLISYLDHTNNQSFDETNFNTSLDDFYKLEIVNNILHVTMPSGRVINTGDMFKKTNEHEYIFLNRDHTYLINNELVDILQMKNFLNKYIQSNFDIVADILYNEIYLISRDELNLDILNNILKENQYTNISKHLIASPLDFFNSVKFDANAVRLECRKLNADYRPNNYQS